MPTLIATLYRGLLSNILLAHCTIKPFHHASYKSEHLMACVGEKADQKLEMGEGPMLVKQYKQFEDACACITGKQGGLQ